jgi:hypothetical protein
LSRTQTLFIGLSLGLILSFGVVADGVDRVIVLKDGSRIRGEIISVENDLYRIESDSMGTILLGSNQIQSILSGEESGSSPAEGSLSRAAEGSLSRVAEGSLSRAAEGSLSRAAEGSQSAEGSSSQIQRIQSSMMSNPGVMSSIFELQNDPAMQAVLADPEVMQAIQSFDLEALARNPKIKALMNDPRLKRIQGTLQ